MNRVALSLFVALAAQSEFPGEGSTPEGGSAAIHDFFDSENYCAGWAVFHACRSIGGEAALEDVHRILPPRGQPIALGEVRRALRSLVIDSFPKTFVESRLRGPSRPMIIPIVNRRHPGGHYVLIAGWNDHGVAVVDLWAPPRIIPHERLRQDWNGAALVMGHARPWEMESGWPKIALGGTAIGLLLLYLTGRGWRREEGVHR